MSDMGLTPNQLSVLSFIRGFFEEKSYPPSFQEMLDHCGFRSKSEIHRIVTALEERGHIHRIPKCARAIGLGPAPTLVNKTKCPHCGGPISDAVQPQVKRRPVNMTGVV